MNFLWKQTKKIIFLKLQQLQKLPTTSKTYIGALFGRPTDPRAHPVGGDSTPIIGGGDFAVKNSGIF